MTRGLNSWRSVLFVPGDRPDLAAKAPRSAPDAIVLDLEDAVPAARKTAARAGVRAAIRELDGHAVLVRVNSTATEWFEDDLVSLPAGISAIMVPKWETPIDVGYPVIAGLETVRGVADARSILGGVAACYFGAEDYVADLGGVRSKGNAEIATARAMVGMAARLAGIPAIDMVTTDFGDIPRFTAEAAEARGLGYAGKLCIHPAQVAVANDAFLPTAEEEARAKRLLAAFDAAGGRAMAFEGQMVDEVTARQARDVLARRGSAISS